MVVDEQRKRKQEGDTLKGEGVLGRGSELEQYPNEEGDEDSAQALAALGGGGVHAERADGVIAVDGHHLEQKRGGNWGKWGKRTEIVNVEQ